MVFSVEEHIGDWGPRTKYRELFKLGENEKLIWGLQQLNQVPGGLDNRLEQVVRRSCIGDIAGMGRMEVQAMHGPYAATLRDAVGFLSPAEDQEANQQPQEVRFSGPNEAFNVSIDCVSFAPLE